jgi:Domain of unknown function (DUF4105)
MKLLRLLAFLLLFLVCIPVFAWTFGALYYDGPSKWLAWGMACAVMLAAVFVREWWRKLAVIVVWFGIVLAWWLTLKPSNQGDWQVDVALKPWAEINGDEVTVHNVRNCVYRTDTDYTVVWETRKVRLSQLTHIDLFINYWGSPWMAHPIVSFQFADAPPLCFSIETRKRVGQTYSAIGGLYRQYHLIFIAADERDVIRVRTNYRKGEDAYLYRTTTGLKQTRKRFLEYINSINELNKTPRWYNAITTNCTTAIRSQHPAAERMAWDWRLLINGKGDELMYERNEILTDGLPFTELKRRALINSAARAVTDSPDFSTFIRKDRPGFEPAR